MIPHMKNPVHNPSRPALLVAWLRCHACKRGYFLAGAPAPQSCQCCGSGQLLPVALWDLRNEASPSGMLSRKEVHRAHVG
jgi:hypothetical protein